MIWTLNKSALSTFHLFVKLLHIVRQYRDEGVAEDGGHTPANRLTETYSHGLYYLSSILHNHVLVNWHLSKHIIRWPVSRNHIAGSSVVAAYRGHLFFEVGRWPSAGFRLDRRPFYCLLPIQPRTNQQHKPHNHSVENLSADQVRGQTRERTHRHPAKGCREIWGWLFLRIFLPQLRVEALKH